MYERVDRLSARGEILETWERGELSRDVVERNARPHLHPGTRALRSRAFDLHEEGGTRLRGLQVLESEDVVPAPPEPSPGVEVDPRLAAKLEVAADDEVLPVSLFFRDYPRWDVPLSPAPGYLSVEEAEAAAVERADAIARRQATWVARREELAPAVEAEGGAVHEAHGWAGGWLRVDVPARGVRALLERSDLRRVALEDGIPREAASLGDAGDPTRASTGLYDTFGYTGERDSGRGSFGDITIAIAEIGLFEDEARFLCDAAGSCTGTNQRLRKRRMCSNPEPLVPGACDEVANLPDDGGADFWHGTRVASIAIGDYTDDQGEGFYLGDTTTSHSAAWEHAASGVAREASLTYVGNLLDLPEALSDAVVDGADVFNMSLQLDHACRVKTTSTSEVEVEVAYLDGIFVAACSGNDPDSSGLCDIPSPAGVPTAFTIGGLGEVDGPFLGPCDDYPSCVLEGYRHGGGDVKDWTGTLRVRSQSMNDLHAPSMVSRATEADGTYGEVTDAARPGCSFATPFVAGAAAVAKDYFLAKGHGWIHDPGQLHTVMLAMGDRTQEKGASPAQEPTTPDWDWGFGKLKMRLFEPLAPAMTPYGFDRLSVFLTTFSSHATLVLNGGATLPSGTSLVKCVSHQSEYMDDKDRVSDIDLELELYAPFSGSCSVVTPVTLRSDAGWDTSRFVAFESSEATLAGKCARVRLKKAGVTSSGIGVHAFCYYAGMDDDEPS